jgi:nucleoside-diphosphate-sugar epimerase
MPTPGFLPPVTGWVETLSHPAVVDTTKAHRELGWTPTWTGLAALRSMTAAVSDREGPGAAGSASGTERADV